MIYASEMLMSFDSISGTAPLSLWGLLALKSLQLVIIRTFLKAVCICISVDIKGISFFTRQPCNTYHIYATKFIAVSINSPSKEHRISVLESRPKQKVRSDAMPRLSFTSSLRLCLRVLRGRQGKSLEKRNEQVEEIDDIERGRLWGFLFLHNTKSFSFRGTQKLY
jgi:hypothetical protein